MSWNITNDPSYAVELDRQFMERMKNLRYRKEELRSAVDSLDVSRFSKIAPIWSDKEKSLELVEGIFDDLANEGKFKAHFEFFSVWAEVVHRDPMRFYENFHFQNYPISFEKSPNELFESSDRFEVLNALLAVDPVRCLKLPNLLSGAWLEMAMKPETRDIALIGIMSGFVRYTSFHNKNSYRTEYATPVETHAKDFFQLLGSSIGMSVYSFVDNLPESPKDITPQLNKYYSKLIGELSGGYGYPSQPIPQLIESRSRPEELFRMAIKIRLMSTKSHIKYNEARWPKNENKRYLSNDEDLLWSRVLNCDLTDLKQARAVLKSYSLNEHHIKLLEERGFIKDYLKWLPEKDRAFLIETDVIPIRLISKVSELGNKFSQDLGL